MSDEDAGIDALIGALRNDIARLRTALILCWQLVPEDTEDAIILIEDVMKMYGCFVGEEND